MLYPVALPRFACRLCSFEGSTGADSHGSNSSGMAGGDGGGGGGGNGGNDGTGGLSFGTSGQGDTDYSGSSTDRGGLGDDTAAGNSGDNGIVGTILDALFGGPRTGDRVVDAAITGWLSSVPLAGIGMALTNAARDRGYSVVDADLPSSPSAGYDGYQGFTPYRTGSTNPFASQATPQASTAWAPQGSPALDPYMLPQANPAAALAAPSAGSGAIASVDPYKAPEKPSWPLLLVAAGILAGLAL